MLRDDGPLERKRMDRGGGDAAREVETEANLGSSGDRKVDRIAQGRSPCWYGDRSAAAKGDGADRSWLYARQVNRHRDRDRAYQERGGTVFVRETDTNPRAAHGYPCALSYCLPIYLQQRLRWGRGRNQNP